MHPPIREYKQADYPRGNITQWFGENKTLYNRWGLAGHNGIDIVAPHGTDLLAVEDATVICVNNNPEGYGKYVRILSKRHVGGKHREWTYGHLSNISVEVGDELKAGDKLGEMGNTGFVVSGSTPFWKFNPFAGTHLHLGLRLMVKDKAGWSYKGSDIKINVVDYGNGYKGSINPAPYFTNTTSKSQKLLTLLSLKLQLLRLLQRLSTDTR